MKTIFSKGFFLIALLYACSVSAQSDSLNTIRKIHAFSIRSEKGFILVQNPRLENIRHTFPDQYSLDYSRLYNDTATYNLYGALIRRGFALSYVNYNSSIVGHGYLLGYFVEPMIRLSGRTYMTLKGELGLSYQSNPFGPDNDYQNFSYSTHLNSNMHLAGGFSYMLSDHLSLTANGHLHHISNTAFNHPNLGVNWITGSLSLSYYPDGARTPAYTRHLSDAWKKEKIKKSIYLFFSPGQSYYQTYQFQRNYVLGIDAELSKKMSQINEITAGIETYYNNIVPDNPTRFEHNQASILSGLMIGHRLLMNRFAFSQQLGFYITPFPSHDDEIFFRLGLDYEISSRIRMGVNFRDHGKTADFLDFRIGYVF